MIFILCSGCNEKTVYTGKIFNKENLDFTELKNKEEVTSKLGNPNFIDPIEKKYYYFTEKFINKNFYDNKIDSRKLIVFNFNIDESINSIEEYDLSDQQKMKIISETTQNNLLEKGLIENIFGGIGKGPSTTP